MPESRSSAASTRSSRQGEASNIALLKRRAIMAGELPGERETGTARSRTL
jgi:hypothetical protein